MCQHGDEVKITILQEILVDKCIAEEIKWLNDQGVRTEGCCCGHGKYYPSALITPKSVNKALKLGYSVRDYYLKSGQHSGLFEIMLKKKVGGLAPPMY